MTRRAARPPGDVRRLARRPGVLCRQLDGETILLDPVPGTYYALNEVGSRVWELAAERLTVGTILDRLEGEYAVDRATLERDLEALVERLVAEDLLEVVTPSGEDPGDTEG